MQSGNMEEGQRYIHCLCCVNSKMYVRYKPTDSSGLPSGKPATQKKGRGNFTSVACLDGFNCVTNLQNLQGCPHPPSSWLNVPRVGQLHGGKAEVISQLLSM